MEAYIGIQRGIAVHQYICKTCMDISHDMEILVQANLQLICNTLSHYIACNRNNRIEGVLSPRFLEVSVLT